MERTQLLETARRSIENGEWRRAERLLKQAGRTLNGGAAGLEVVELCLALAAGYRQAQLIEQAIKILNWATGLTKSDAAEHGRVMRALGEIYVEAGRFDAAADSLASALETHQTSLGEAHAETIQDLSAFGILAQKVGQPDRAAVLFLAAIERQEQIAGPDSPELIGLLKARAAALLDSDLQHEDACKPAEDCLLRALRLQERSDPDSIEVGWTLLDLADLRQDHDECDEALVLATRGWNIGRQRVQQEPGLFDETTSWLKWWYEVHGDFHPLVEILRAALELRTTLLGPDHPKVAETMGTLAEVLLADGAGDQAEALCARGLEILVRQYGEMPAASEFLEVTPDQVASVRLAFASLLYVQAAIYLERDLLLAARFLNQRALLMLDVAQEELAEDTRTLLATARADLLRQLAHVETAAGNDTAAERVFQRAIGEANKGETEALADVLFEYADWLESRGRAAEAEQTRKEAESLRADDHRE